MYLVNNCNRIISDLKRFYETIVLRLYEMGLLKDHSDMDTICLRMIAMSEALN